MWTTLAVITHGNTEPLRSILYMPFEQVLLWRELPTRCVSRTIGNSPHTHMPFVINALTWQMILDRMTDHGQARMTHHGQVSGCRLSDMKMSH